MAIEWMVDAHAALSLEHENTLFQAVSFFDRFLTQHEIAGNETQLLAMACLSLAAKMHESEQPSLGYLAALTDDACTAAQGRSAEIKLVEGLEYRLAVPTLKV